MPSRLALLQRPLLTQSGHFQPGLNRLSKPANFRGTGAVFMLTAIAANRL
jgi:hypothetical protein